MMDQESMRSLIEHKHEGACFHCYAANYFEKMGLHGYSALHKTKSKEEYDIYIDMIQVYVDNFGDMPIINKAESSANRFQIDESADFPTKMAQGLEAYEDYEKGVLDFYKHHKHQMNGGSQDPVMSKLMKDVKEELKFIDELEEEMESSHYDMNHLKHLDQWLVKKYDKTGNKIHYMYGTESSPGKTGYRRMM